MTVAEWSRWPRLPANASPRAIPYSLSLSATCFIHTRPPRSRVSCAHACRASSANALCFFAFHAPVAMRAAWGVDHLLGGDGGALEGGGRLRPSARSSPPYKARRRRRKFWPRKAQINKNRPRSPQSSRSAKAVACAHSTLLVGLSCCLLLLLLPRLLLPPWQQPCCRAFGSHDGPPAAGELVRRVGQGVRRTSRRLARDARRVSAAFRRGAAAYGVASRPLEEARTHGCLLS